MDRDDPVLDQLKRLREGRGLTVEKLSEAPELLAALGTSEPQEASRGLLVILDRLGESERSRALKVDLGLELDTLLEHRPTGRERDWLGDRRTSYGQIIGRDPKTLARWSDRTLAELRAHLLREHFTGQVVVAAGVKNRRVAGIEVLQFEESDAELSQGRNTSYTNPEAEPSMPLVLYGFPREWQPSVLRFIVSFIDEEPTRMWALVADNVMDVGFGHERTELQVVDGMARCKIENPRYDQLYGVWWEWPGQR